jgi:hypothetical protein
MLDDASEVHAIAQVRRRYRVARWQKVPDEPLGVVVGAKPARRRASAMAGKTLRQVLLLTHAA